MSEGVGYPAHPPVVGLIGDRPDDCASGSDSAVEDGVRVVDGENEADGASVERLGAEVLVFRRLISEPEVRSVDGEISDDRAAFGRCAEDHRRSEGGLVEVDGPSSVADVEEWGEGGF